MPAPADATYSSLAKSAASTAFRDLIDEGAGTATIKFRDNSDNLLATVNLQSPCGTVGPQGQLTLSVSGTPTVSADGDCAYAEGAGRLRSSVMQSLTVVLSSLALRLCRPLLPAGLTTVLPGISTFCTMGLPRGRLRFPFILQVHLQTHSPSYSRPPPGQRLECLSILMMTAVGRSVCRLTLLQITLGFS